MDTELPDFDKQQKRELQRQKFREKIRDAKMYSVLVIAMAALSIILVRLFYVQIVQGGDYREKARRQYESKVEIKAERGKIIDVHGTVLATTVRRRSVAVDPKMVEQPERIAKYLSELTGLPASQYMERIRRTKGAFVWLARSIPNQAASPLDTMRDKGLILIEEPRRHYAFGRLAAPLIGYSDIDNKGVTGIESAYDSLLQGIDGYTIMMRDGKGRKRVAPGYEVLSPEHGADVMLTLDARLQRYAEDEIARQVLATGAESGIVVVIRPKTGEIAAMASFPTFDPNTVASSNPEERKNRAIGDVYEPGSTFKIVTAAALLEEKIIHPDDSVDGKEGVWRYKDATIRDAHAIGRVTFREAFEQSSNIVFAEQALRLPRNTFYKYIRDFGFGVYHGVEIPGELRGMVKKPKDFDGTSQAFMSYGYQLTATPLQIAAAYAAIANEGVLMRPFLVKSTISKEGDTTLTQPQKVRKVVSKETANTLRQFLQTSVEFGTGKAARLPSVVVGGKTGTAQQLLDGSYSKQYYTASFAGVLPADNPEFVVLVMINKPQSAYYGGVVAAPVFAAIARRVVASGMLEGAVEKLPLTRLNREYAAFTPDVRGLTIEEARRYAEPYNCDVRATSKEGIIIAQKPSVGDSISFDRLIVVQTADKDTLFAEHKFPSLKGLAVRRALKIAHYFGFETEVIGSGLVEKHHFQREGNRKVIRLYCKELAM